MIWTYYDQLEHLARKRGLVLKRVMEELGYPNTTFMRWAKGLASPSLPVAERVAAALMTENFSACSIDGKSASSGSSSSAGKALA